MLGFHDGKIGLDYEVNRQTIIGALLTIYNRRWDMDATNSSLSYSNQHLDTTVTLLVHEFHPTFSYDININLQHSCNEGEKLTVNLDHMYYNDVNPVSYINSYYAGSGAFLFEEQLKSEKTTPINLWIGALDYTKSLSKKFVLEGGAKTTISHFTNLVQINRLQGGSWTTDDGLSATYDLNENISAAYSSLSWRVNDKTNMKLGLRYEYTNSNLGTAKVKNIVDRHYGNLFPSFFFSRTINERNAVNFSYSRRVTRPTFWNLAPFVIFMDPNTYFTGNPGLQPSITDNINLSYTYKKKILSIAYSYEADPITNFSPKIDPKTNKETLSAENQDAQKTITVSLSFPIDITKWWSVQGNVNGSFQQMDGLYQGQPIRLENKYFILNTTQNFRLPKDFTVSLSGFYRSGGLFGIYKVDAIGSLDFGIQKKLADKKSSLRFNFSNILNTMVLKPEINLPEKNLVAKNRLIFTRPNLRITFTHNFGGTQVKGKRNRSLGTEEEKSRLQQ